MVATAPDRRISQSASIKQRRPIAAVCYSDCVGAATTSGGAPIGSGVLSSARVGSSLTLKSGGPSEDANVAASQVVMRGHGLDVQTVVGILALCHLTRNSATNC